MREISGLWFDDSMSKYLEKYSFNDYSGYWDDSIIKLNINGEIIFRKSVTEILIENKLVDDYFFQNTGLKAHDPIHLNDIELALNDTNIGKKASFLSARHLSQQYIIGQVQIKWLIILQVLFMQHDVDIISNNEISIFNNNNFIINNEYSSYSL